MTIALIVGLLLSAGSTLVLIPFLKAGSSPVAEERLHLIEENMRQLESRVQQMREVVDKSGDHISARQQNVRAQHVPA